MTDLDLLPDGVVVAGADGIVTLANVSALRMLARPSAAVVGRHVGEALPFDDLHGNTWFACVRPYDGLASRTRLAETSWYASDGTELLLTARLLRAEPRGPVDELVVGLRDARVRARRDRERSDLVATVAHELRSPLTGVKGFTATLLSKWDRFSDDQRLLMLRTIDADADRLSRLITELLDAARIDSGRLTLRSAPIDLGVLVRRVLDNVSAGSGGPLVAEVDEDLPRVWADEDRVIQVVTNLVENAMRHGRGLDKVIVRSPVDARDGAVIVVKDVGPGVPEDIRSRVFTRFWKSGDRGGSGLGLFIVRGIVDRHDGQVAIRDGIGGGAEFVVWFPRNEPDALRD